MRATRTKTAAMSISEACRPRRSNRNDRPDARFDVSDMWVRCRALARSALVPLCASCVVANKIIMSPVVYFLPPGRDCFSPRPTEQRDTCMAKARSFAALNGAPPSASVQRTQRPPPSPPSASLAVIVPHAHPLLRPAVSRWQWRRKRQSGAVPRPAGARGGRRLGPGGHPLAALVAGGGWTRAGCSRRSRSARTQHRATRLRMVWRLPWSRTRQHVSLSAW